MKRFLFPIAVVVVPLAVFLGVTAVCAWFFGVNTSDVSAIMPGFVFGFVAFFALLIAHAEGDRR